MSDFEKAWREQQENFNKLIERVEAHPCAMSCYLSVKEYQAAADMKETILQILKGEL
jgi:hypothetical protein